MARPGGTVQGVDHPHVGDGILDREFLLRLIAKHRRGQVALQGVLIDRREFLEFRRTAVEALAGIDGEAAGVIPCGVKGTAISMRPSVPRITTRW